MSGNNAFRFHSPRTKAIYVQFLGSNPSPHYQHFLKPTYEEYTNYVCADCYPTRGTGLSGVDPEFNRDPDERQLPSASNGKLYPPATGECETCMGTGVKPIPFKDLGFK